MGSTCAQASAINGEGHCCNGQRCQARPFAASGEHEVDDTGVWSCSTSSWAFITAESSVPGGPGQGRRRIAVAVMRHGERLDRAAPKQWKRHEDAKRYPFDPPLTMRGRNQVGSVVHDMKGRCQGVRFSMVVSSPFIRCVETAVEACNALKLPICIDRSLGEVFNEECIGRCDAPGPTLRSEEEVLQHLPPDLRRTCNIIGTTPTWPESLEEGRLRMVSRAEQYASRGVRLGGAGFLLVTHGDGVAACLVLALAGVNRQGCPSLRRVQYCGYVVLDREFDLKDPEVGLMDPKACWRVHHGNVQIDEGANVYDPDRRDELEAAASRAAGDRRSYKRRGSTLTLDSAIDVDMSVKSVLSESGPLGQSYEDLREA